MSTPPTAGTLDQTLSRAAAMFGVAGSRRRLPGERTLNVVVENRSGPLAVVKLHDPADRPDVELEVAVLHHLAASGVGGVPAPMLAADGSPLVEVAADGGVRLARALSWLPGDTWAATPAPRRHPAALAELGALVARVDRALTDFDHPRAGRPLRWNLTAAGDAVELLTHVPDPVRREAAAHVLAAFRDRTAPTLATLPAQVIHNDANDANVLLDAGGHVAGLVDFGDLCLAPRVCGLAVALAYAMASALQDGAADPVRAVLPLVTGYHRVAPLTPTELTLVLPLVRARLAVSIVMAGWQHARDPDNDYLLVSQDGVWSLLQALSDPRLGDDHLTLCRLRDAVGYEADPRSRAVRAYLSTTSSAPVLGRPLAETARLTLDWSSAPSVSDARASDARASDQEQDGNVSADVDRRLVAAGAEVGIGRWCEDRAVYTTPAFAGMAAPEGSESQRRTVHLGVDLFAPAGTVVHAPLDGVVHALADNAAPLDYGPVMVLRHELPGGGGPFFTLYGHLSRESLDGRATGEPLTVGQAVAAGRPIATIGREHENGGWPPHLHLQVLTDLVGRGVDVPGVAPRSEVAVWSSIAPDPNLVLGLPEGVAAPSGTLAAQEITRRRVTRMSPALSLSYSDPLHIVSGHGAHLVDTQGREWLDLVNNVAHVGHAHPRVVAAAAAQQTLLNTNTRYLHSGVVEYARRLVATLPDPLSVCFFVNSGSEANDLALRLAYAHTAARDVLVLDHAYHGHLLSLIDVSPYKFDGPGGLGRPATTHVVPIADPYRGRHRTAPGEPSASVTAAYLAEVDARLDDVARAGRTVAAFLSEPMPGTAGQVVLADGFLAGAYERVRAAGGVCIADEVQIGFGRPGSHMWGFEAHGVVPDVVTMGKPIGNGHPVGAVVTTPQVAASFLTGMEYFNTFGGNPVSAAVGLAVLDVISDERLQARALRLGEALLRDLRAVGARHPLVGDVRGTGLFLGVELVSDPEARTPAGAAASAVVEGVKRRGVLLSSDGPDHNVLKIKPPMVLDENDCAHFVTALDEALTEVGATAPSRSPGQ